MPRKALAGCIISLFGRNPNWSHSDQNDKVSGWLHNLSGRIDSKFGPSVTHLVVSQKRWKEEPRPTPLANALREKANGRDLKIVTFDWLEDCFNSQTRKREAAYEWDKCDAATGGKKSAKSAPGMLAEVFHESTEQYVDPEEARRLERRLEREKEEKKAREKEAKEERYERRKQQAKIFARGAARARNALLSESHHIYQDSTGFRYDVQVTKVDARKNRNEVWALTLYESNAQPPTYATNAQFKGTRAAPQNTVVIAIGSNYLTAMHAFRSEFEKLTGIDWDERLSAHIKRMRAEKMERGVGTGSPAPGSVRGVAVSESATREVEFEKRKYEYHPPGYGPKGEVTDEEVERMARLGVKITQDGAPKTKKTGAPVVDLEEESEALVEQRRDAVEGWRETVHPEDGEGTTEAAAPASAGAGMALEDMDFDKMVEEAGIYPFEKPVPEANEDSTQQASVQDLQASNDWSDVHDEREIFQDPKDSAVKAGQDTAALETADQDQAVDLTEPQDVEGDPIDWSAVATEMLGDQEWLEAQLATLHDPQQTQEAMRSQHDSFQLELPNFATHPTEGASFQHGTQEIGETQVAERAGGEFLEDFAGDSIAAKSPVDSAVALEQEEPAAPRKPSDAASKGNESEIKESSGEKKGKGLGEKMFGGLNLGRSVLGKRKDSGVAAESGRKDAVKTQRGLDSAES